MGGCSLFWISRLCELGLFQHVVDTTLQEHRNPDVFGNYVTTLSQDIFILSFQLVCYLSKFRRKENKKLALPYILIVTKEMEEET